MKQEANNPADRELAELELEAVASGKQQSVVAGGGGGGLGLRLRGRY